eukprot:gene6339-10346_t
MKTLPYFILRRQTLEQYKKFLKKLRTVKDQSLKESLKEEIRIGNGIKKNLSFFTEYKRNLKNEDIERGKYFLREGEEKFKKLTEIISFTE